MIRTRKHPYPEGDFAVWMIVYIEMVTFGVFFIGFSIAKQWQLPVFQLSQQVLNQTSGLVDMLLLIISSYFMVKAVQRVRHGHDPVIANTMAARWLLATLLFGGLFLLNKASELNHLFDQGIGLSSNRFFMLYLLLSMFHWMHVMVGCVAVWNTFKQARLARYTPSQMKGLESAAIYWHLLDLLWIILFVLFYVVR